MICFLVFVIDRLNECLYEGQDGSQVRAITAGQLVDGLLDFVLGHDQCLVPVRAVLDSILEILYLLISSNRFLHFLLFLLESLLLYEKSFFTCWCGRSIYLSCSGCGWCGGRVNKVSSVVVVVVAKEGR